MKKTVIFALLCFLFSYTNAQYKGKIFVDLNKNGKFDFNEKLLRNVSVSDGLNVVSSSDKGEYSLKGHPDAKFIFITTPSGYKTENKHYRPILSGTNEYDFGLLPYEGRINNDGSHQFIHISDTEIGESSEHQDWVSNLRDYASNEKAAFIIHTGDICYKPGLKNHISLMNTANMNTPVFYCIGNHDLVQGKYGEEYFESFYGPTYYSFDAGNTHYIVTPMAGGDYRPSYTREQVYRWLKNDLEKVRNGQSVVIFNHDLLDQTGLFRFGINKDEYIDLPKHNLKAWIYGHWHINHMIKHPESGVYSICTSTLIRGGIDHASSGFRVIKIDRKGNLSSKLRYSYINKSIQIASVGNLHSPTLSNGKTPVSVNAYSTTSPIVKVACTYSSDRLPSSSSYILKQMSDFNWYTEVLIPERLNGQLVTLSVTAFFANGEIAKTNQSFFYHSKSTSQVVIGTPVTNLLGSASHSGVSTDTLGVSLELNWVKNLGSNLYMTSPIIYNQAVYVATIDENCDNQAGVFCMDAATGTIRWKYPTIGSIKNSIAVTAGTVFAQDIYGNLYALDANTGRLKWRKKLNIGLLPALNDGLIATDNVVYAGTGQGLCALNATDGKEIWTNKSWMRGEGCTATLSLNNNILIGHSHWRGLYANNAQTGDLLWRHTDYGLRHRSSSAAMHGSTLYILSDESLFVIESATGKIIVRKQLGYNVNVTSTPLVTDSEIIFGTADRGVVALDKGTLTEKWNFKTRPAIIYSAPYVRNPSSTVESSPINCGRNVYVTASDGYIYGLDRSTGKLTWQYSTGAPFFATASVSGNALFASDFSGNVYGFVTINAF